MADDADRAQDGIDAVIAEGIELTGRDIPVGVAGICSECEEPSPRLILGECARCRDELLKIRTIRGCK
jgi:hypothetical protein